MNHLTRLRRDRHVFSEKLLNLLAEQAEQQSDHLDVRRRTLAFCIEQLKDDDQKTLAGCYQESSTIKKFAEATGQTPNAIYKRLNRIRAALLRCAERRFGLGVKIAENKVHIHDLHATLLWLMGLNHRKLTFRYSGRDQTIADIHGKVVKGVFA